MRIMSGARAAIVGAVVLLALSGCGLPTPAHPSSAGTHGTTPRPTATTAALTAPRSAIPTTCAQLLPTATAAGAFPAASGIAVRESESTAPQDAIAVGARQAGGLHCLWGGTERQDNGYVDYISLDVLGAAAVAYHDNVTTSPGDEVNTFGTASDAECQGDPQFFCFAQVLIGTTWIELDYNSLGGEGEPASGSLARFNTLLTGIVTRVQGAGANRPLWTPPAAWDGASLCTDAALTRVRAATGHVDLVQTDYSMEGPLTAASASLARLGFEQCGWAREAPSGLTLFGLQFVQGGAWAMAQELAQPPSFYYGTLAPVSIAGATSALALCNEAACQADLAVAGSWMSVQASGVTSMDELTHDIAALLAATPH
ncbi:MAG: hypothetical protein ABIS08_01365 [Pseudolysinimonas sp.]